MLGAAPAAAARPAGLTWGVEDLGTALGVLGRRDASGALTFTFQLARSACLLAAAALGVPAIDGVHVDFRDAQGLKGELDEARRDGFSGKLAIHPDQVPVINAAFVPTAAECAQARRIVAAFASAGGAGVASLDGQMIDRPHLLQAQRTWRPRRCGRWCGKLRIKGATLRLRLTAGEIRAARARSGRGAGALRPGVSLIYRLRKDAAARRSAPPIAATSWRSWCRRPRRMVVCVANQQVTLAQLQAVGGAQLNITLEKDFACLAPRAGEDESDVFRTQGGATKC